MIKRDPFEGMEVSAVGARNKTALVALLCEHVPPEHAPAMTSKLLPGQQESLSVVR